MAITLDGTTGITTPTYGGTIPSEYYVPVTAFKNRIINGAMMIDQRNAGASQTLGSSYTYTVDRWFTYSFGASCTGQRVSSGIIGIPNVYQITGASNVTSVQFMQRIEAKNISDCAGSLVTLSALISNSLLTSVSWAAFYANAEDNWSASTQIATGTWTINNTLTSYNAQISLPANAANGVWIVFTTGAQTSGTWKIGNVQLEKGTTATSFDYRPYGTELALCQRYFLIQKETLNNSYMVGYFLSATVFRSNFTFPVTLRASPTFSSSAANTFLVQNFIANSTLSALSIVSSSPYSAYVLANVSSSVSGGQGGALIDSTGSFISFSAEL